MRKIFGIVNCTPDSFYDGQKYYKIEDALSHALALAEEGADILDIGGESTRPFAENVAENEELDRVIPVISKLHSQVKIPLSIDTRKPKVAEIAVASGASIINDVTGLSSKEMRKLVATLKVKAVVMHIKETPQTMQLHPFYPKGVITELLEWFVARLALIHQEGISKEQIILDPGIGFGKSVDDNLKILENIPAFTALGYPVMIGLSRKFFMQKILGKPAREVLSTTIALNTMSMLAGASFIRVHDVKEHRQVIDLLNYWETAIGSHAIFSHSRP